MPTRNARSLCAPFPDAEAASTGRRALFIFVLRGILDGELRKTGMPYPSVPEALGSGVGSLLADEALVAVGPEIAVGRSPCPCESLPMATVEIACLKINCSWLLVSRTTEYLSKERIRPVNLTPLSK